MSEVSSYELLKAYRERVAQLESDQALLLAYYEKVEQLIWREDIGVSHSHAYAEYQPARAAIEHLVGEGVE